MEANMVSVKALWLLSFFFVTQYSHQSARFSFVQSEGLSIHIAKSSLALAALRDSHPTEAKEFDEFSKNRISQLLLVEDLEPKIQQGPRVFQPEQGITLSKDNIIFTTKQEVLAKGLQANVDFSEIADPLRLSRDDALREMEFVRNVISKKLPGLNYKQRLMLEDSIYSEEILETDFSEESLSSRATELALRAKVQLQLQQIEDQKTESRALASNGLNALLLAMNQEKGKNPKVRFGPPKSLESVPEMSVAGNDSIQASAMSLSSFSRSIEGNIELKKGLAYIPDQHVLEVVHMNEGEVLSKAHIQIYEASFDIHTDTTEGWLLAEIYDNEGKLLGAGEFDLTELSDDQLSLDRIKGIQIDIYPFEPGLHLDTVSAYSFGSEVKMAENVEVRISDEWHKQRDVRMHAESVLPGSTLIAEVKAKDAVPSLQILGSNESQEHRVLPKKMHKALLASLKELGVELNSDSSIVWGRVEDAEGLKVEVSAQEAEGPFYFNEFKLLSKEQTSLHRQAYFVIANLDPGLHAIRIQRPEATQNYYVYTEVGKISYIDWKKPRKSQIILSYKNAMNSEPVFANSLLSIDDTLIEQASEIEILYEAEGLQFVDIQADGFPNYRLYYQNQKNFNELSLIPNLWWNEQNNFSGNKILIYAKDFERVLLDGDEINKVHYFDQMGEPCNKESAFFVLIDNLEEGLYQVQVEYADGYYSSKLVYAEEFAISLILE